MKSNQPSRRQVLFGFVTGLFGCLRPYSTRANEPKQDKLKEGATSTHEAGGAVTTYIFDEQKRLIAVVHPIGTETAIWRVGGNGADDSNSG